MTLLIHSARLVSADRAGTMQDAPGSWITVDAGRVTAIGRGDTWRERVTPGTEVVDARALAGDGALLTPGFVDIHGHGGGGASFDDGSLPAGAESVRAALAVHAAHGTTRSVLSLVTADPRDLAARAAVVADLTASEPGVLGSHLEGPFLDPGHKGAHAPELLRTADPAVIDALLEAGRGTIRQVTIAPERPGGMAAIRRLVAAGVAVAVGHTAADARQAAAAFDAGASILTHAFNAMPGLHHRNPGPVGAAASDLRVTLEAIADGVHVDPIVLRMLFEIAPDRIALITDAMAATGAGDGHYRLGALDVEVTDGVARLRGTDTIAGSTLTQDRAVRTAVAAGVPLAAAIRAVTFTPARAIGRSDLGALAVGEIADAVVLTASGDVRGVWRDGRPLV